MTILHVGDEAAAVQRRQRLRLQRALLHLRLRAIEHALLRQLLGPCLLLRAFQIRSGHRELRVRVARGRIERRILHLSDDGSRHDHAPRLDEELIDHAALRGRYDAHAIRHERSLRAHRAHEGAFAHDVGNERRALDGRTGMRARAAQRPADGDEGDEPHGNCVGPLRQTPRARANDVHVLRT